MNSLFQGRGVKLKRPITNWMGFVLLFCLLQTVLTPTYSQSNKNYRAVDKEVKRCPTGYTKSIKGLTDFINANFATTDQKIRAVYVWIAQNIVYDFESIFIERTNNPILETKKGICQDYANLFKSLAKALGIETYTVQGYTKQNGKIVWQPHAWVVAKLEDGWYFFDPTWGSGFVENERFYRKLDDQYFKVSPQEFIKTHIPYDPFWQILNEPISPKTFDANVHLGKKLVNTNFSNELYEKSSLDEVEQLKQEITRIENNGISNYLLYFVLREKKAYARAFEHQLYLDKYNESEFHYEEGVFLLNEFIIYRNKFFEPFESDLDLKKRIGNIIDHLESAQELLGEVTQYPEGINHSASNLKRALDLTFYHVNEHKEFVKLYIETPLDKRQSLFYD